MQNSPNAWNAALGWIPRPQEDCQMGLTKVFMKDAAYPEKDGTFRGPIKSLGGVHLRISVAQGAFV